jgi:hypothetical protein
MTRRIIEMALAASTAPEFEREALALAGRRSKRDPAG